MVSDKKKSILRVAAAGLVLIGLLAFGYAIYNRSDAVDRIIVFSERTMLSGLWDAYKQEYWEEGTGRTVDKQSGNITTSEGQSYTMLRAVWQSDQATFDKAWGWTKQQLQRSDSLFAWKWGMKSDKSYGVLVDQGGQNTASDADSDIALALLMAAARWQQQKYLDEARSIITSLWKNEVIMVGGRPYLASNNLEKDSRTDAIINPSYLSPYAYRIFAQVDTSHDWVKLVDSSYDLISRAIDEPLNVTASAGLVPDWIAMNKQTGAISAVVANNALTTNFGYDAMRITWRLALDYEWNKSDRAKQVLQKLSFIKQEWEIGQTIYSTYSHDGQVVKKDEVPESYGTSIGYFMVTDPQLATEVYEKRLKNLYDQDTDGWSQKMSYYSDNWAWFGMALYQHQLDNLAKDLK